MAPRKKNKHTATPSLVTSPTSDTSTPDTPTHIPRIFICSPYGNKNVGQVMINIARVKEHCAEHIALGHAPYAPHLIFPRILNDDRPITRHLGIKLGLEFLRVCDALHAYIYDGEPTEGMKIEMAFAKKHNIDVYEHHMD